MRAAQSSDFSFLQTMLYEAVFWRNSPHKPSFEEARAYPEVARSLENWGTREGDTGVIAALNTTPIGAAWYRFWTDDNFINGYTDESMPVVVIGVHHDYRHQGIGGKMISWLIDHAAQNAIHKISLSVSKDNYAINLYRQQGFREYTDRGDSFIMVREI